MLNEIYITLRSKSKFYPYLSPKDVEAFFAKDLGVERKNDMILKTTIHNFCLETCVQGKHEFGEIPNETFLLRH